ncbi:hypothetical protein Rhow_005036 [Rhodococcus wratislaviensis]|uniref:Uncharacterized protein n=1 Tax=Rhodococcus wratislaviensis TaxID=44752 RepID=A0A402CCU6_RHOWR|nr:hypothetical protein Rhow_005036 [Rhodococcus wratislaviensis]
MFFDRVKSVLDPLRVAQVRSLDRCPGSPPGNRALSGGR